MDGYVHMNAGIAEAKGGVEFSGVGVIGSCEPTDLSAGNRTQFVCRNSEHPLLLSCSPLRIKFYISVSLDIFSLDIFGRSRHAHHYGKTLG